MKKVAVVFNGGTISMKVDERIKAAVPSLTGEEIMSMVTGIEDYAELETYTFSGVPSPHMTPSMMLQLSRVASDLLDRGDINGVVVTHGTDTLEETAYFLDLTINSRKPVVITGSMRSGSELGYDGPSNLAASICTAISEEAPGRGVIVCFNGELHCASEVTKANSMSLNAFRTPNFGPIGIVDNNNAIFYRGKTKEETFTVESLEDKVSLIKCVSGMDSKILDFLIESGEKGIVIEALGRGNVPPEMVHGIKRALDKNIPVVIVSRCFEGRVFESYGYLGGGKQLREMGTIFGDTMSGQQARIKLMMALSVTDDLNEIRGYFKK